MKKNKISKNWINKQHRDIYVRKSKIEGYRSRAIYKLKEIDQKFKILKDVHTAIDLGAAPGSWSQYLSEKILNGKILAIDLLEFKKVNKVHQIIGDFSEILALKKLKIIECWQGHINQGEGFKDSLQNLYGQFNVSRN